MNLTFISRMLLLASFLLTGALGIRPEVGFADVPNPDRPEHPIYVSWGDQIMVARGDARLDEPDKIERSMALWKDRYDGKTVLWRIASYYIRRHYDRPDITPSEFSARYRETVEDIKSRFNPVKVASAAADENDQLLLLYMTIFDHGAPPTELYGGTTPFPWQDRFTRENPHVQAVDREGNYHYGVLEMAYPEARDLMVERIVDFVEEFNAHGVYVCTRTHSLPALHADQFGFSEPVVEEFERRHGINILEDERFDYKSEAYDRDDPILDEWRKLRGEYLVQFYRELREALPDRTIYTGIPRGRYLGPPYGNLYLDWESLVEERLVEGLITGVYSNKALHPPLYVPHREIGYLSSEDDHINIPGAEEAISEVYGPVTSAHDVKLFYESRNIGSRERAMLEEYDELQGFMIWTPSTVAGRGSVAHAPELEFEDEMTAEVFLKLNRLPEQHEHSFRVLSKYGHHDQGRHRGWEWIIDHNGILDFRANQENNSDVRVSSESALPVDEWVHVATVYDAPSRELRIYIDGELDAVQRISPLALHQNPGQDLYLGRYGGQDSHHYDGLIDEIRLSNRARTFDARPTAPYTGGESGTVALYQFEEIGPAFRVENAVDPRRLPLRVIGGGESLLVEGMEGFGQAFDMSAPAE